ncbi:TatD family hydrolase [Pseudoclavibacter soli]|uniref:TatD family hydrolase n=1 Tax=Pseudoclavibacter soli TaxID=452623 RepID=UPI00040720E0|nr:TatD family hydrolase [Pseudoclavibacter soli]
MSHKHRDHSYPPAGEPLPIAVYDNHTHIEPPLIDVVPESSEDPHTRPGADALNAPADWIAQLDLAEAVGVRGIVQAGTTLATSRWAAEHAERDRRMLAGVAIHPNEVPAYAAAGMLDDAIAALDALAARDRVRVVGETGLDFHYTESADFDTQVRSFEQHIEIAKAHDIALQIHDRDAHAEVVATLLRVGAPERTVFHCFSGDAELGRVCAEHGWYASFSGTVTFKNAEGVRAGLRELPRDLVLVETDAPYLTPMPYRGRPNAPYLLPNTVRFVAEHLALPLDEFCDQIVANTERVYGAWA